MAATTVPAEHLDWWERGESAVGTALGRLTDEELPGPSLLPGWSRAAVLAHLAGNADGLVDLLHGARSGEETPMYPSPEARDARIAELAAQPAPALRATVLAATGRLAEAVRGMPAAAWSAQVRTISGRTTAASEVPWMRCREVWVHAVDLAAGYGFDDVPDDVLAALVDDVFRAWDRRDAVPDVTLFGGDREWGTGALAVAGSLPAVTAWVTGRSAGEDLRADGPLPALAPWL